MVSSFYVAVPDIFFQTPTFLLSPVLDSYQSNPEKYPRYGVLAADIRVKLSHTGVMKCIMIPDSSADATANDVLRILTRLHHGLRTQRSYTHCPLSLQVYSWRQEDYKIFAPRVILFNELQ